MELKGLNYKIRLKKFIIATSDQLDAIEGLDLMHIAMNKRQSITWDMEHGRVRKIPTTTSM